MRKLTAFLLLFASLFAVNSLKSHNETSLSSKDGDDPIQACLDNMRKKDWENRKNKEKSKVDNQAQVSPYTFQRVEAKDLPNSCQDGDLEAFKTALQRQIARYQDMPEDSHKTKTFQFGCRMFSRQEYSLDTNLRMLEIAGEEKNFPSFISRVKKEFDWFKSNGRLDDSDTNPHLKKGDMQFTAYYLPAPIEASREATDEFRYPFYRIPKDLVHLDDSKPGHCGVDPLTGNKKIWCLKSGESFVALPKRKAIDMEGALKGQNLEIAYVKDPIDIAFLMIQGSGSLKIKDKESPVRINYGAQNGGTRFMLGRILRCAGVPTEKYSSMSGIREYLTSLGDDKLKLMNYDETYIFFNEAIDGPFGVEDIPITPRHTLATDRSVIPTGAVTLFNLERPEGPVGKCDRITSMALAQDTGGAIIGAHVDWYQGEGHDAAARADNVNNPGSLYVAVPKGAGKPVKGCEL